MQCWSLVLFLPDMLGQPLPIHCVTQQEPTVKTLPAAHIKAMTHHQGFPQNNKAAYNSPGPVILEHLLVCWPCCQCSWNKVIRGKRVLVVWRVRFCAALTSSLFVLVLPSYVYLHPALFNLQCLWHQPLLIPKVAGLCRQAFMRGSLKWLYAIQFLVVRHAHVINKLSMPGSYHLATG